MFGTHHAYGLRELQAKQLAPRQTGRLSSNNNLHLGDGKDLGRRVLQIVLDLLSTR